MKSTETIKLKLNEDLRKALIFEARRAFDDDNITLEEAVLKILEDWLKEAETTLVFDEEFFDDPLADALALPEEQRDFFADAAPAVGAGILDKDYMLPIDWNGDRLENVIKARTQVGDILEPHDYHALGRKLFSHILETAENKHNVPFLDRSDEK